MSEVDEFDYKKYALHNIHFRALLKVETEKLGRSSKIINLLKIKIRQCKKSREELVHDLITANRKAETLILLSNTEDRLKYDITLFEKARHSLEVEISRLEDKITSLHRTIREHNKRH